MEVVRLRTGRRSKTRASLAVMASYVAASTARSLVEIRGWKPDVLHAHFAVPAGAAAWVASVATAVPYVLTVHLGDVPGGVPEKTAGWFRWVQPLSRSIWGRASAVVAVSEHTRGLAKRAYGIDPRVIPNGIELKNWPASASPGASPPAIVFVGRFQPQKNLLHLVEVLHRIRDKPWTALLVGDGPLRPAVETRLAEVGLQDRVTLTGWLPPAGADMALASADILFLPSLSEGLPVVGVQALAAGLAIVGSRAGGLAELIEDEVNGFAREFDRPGWLRRSAREPAGGSRAAVSHEGGEPCARRSLRRRTGRAGIRNRAAPGGAPKMSVRRYDFHGLACLEVQTRQPRAGRFFQEEFGFFESAAEDRTPDLRFRWGGPGLPQGLRRHSHKALARWGYRVDFGPTVEAAAQGNRWALPMVHHMMVHPLIRWSASRHGAVLLHAAAVVRKDRSLLIVGEGGSGKTTTSALLLSQADGGWQPHADDYVFLRSDGTSLCYPTRSHLYQNLLAWIPSVGDRLTSSERFRLRVLWAIRTGSQDRLKWPVRVGTDRLWPGQPVATRAQTGAVVLLRRTDASGTTLRRVEPAQVPFDDLIRMNFEEGRHFLGLLSAGTGRPPDEDWPADWRRRETDVLRQALRRTPTFVLEIPRPAGSGASSAETVTGLIEQAFESGRRP